MSRKPTSRPITIKAPKKNSITPTINLTGVLSNVKYLGRKIISSRSTNPIRAFLTLGLRRMLRLLPRVSE